MDLTIAKDSGMNPLMFRSDSRNLVRQTVDRMRSAILEHHFGVSGLLPPEPELTRDLGVSRTVLREALRHLEAQGLVEVSQGRRSRIRPADFHAAAATLELLLRRTKGTMNSLLEVRRPVESEIAALAAQRATEENREALTKAVLDLETAKDLDAQIEADVRFHRELARASQNPVYQALLETLNELMTASRHKTIGMHGVSGAIDGHRKILKEVLARSPDAARRVMLEHLCVTEKELHG